MESRNHELVIWLEIDLNSRPEDAISLPPGLESGRVAIEAGYVGGKGWWRVIGDDDAVLVEMALSEGESQPWERLLAFLGLEQPRP